MEDWKTSNIIKLDYDGKRLPIKRINYVFKMLRLKALKVEVYKTIRVWKPHKRKPDYGWHVRIHTKQKIPIITLGYIQALMGSCYRRETYNLIRIANLLANPKKYANSAITQTWNVHYYKKLIHGKVASIEKYDEEMTKILERLLTTKVR